MNSASLEPGPDFSHRAPVFGVSEQLQFVVQTAAGGEVSPSVGTSGSGVVVGSGSTPSQVGGALHRQVWKVEVHLFRRCVAGKSCEPTTLLSGPFFLPSVIAERINITLFSFLTSTK